MDGFIVMGNMNAVCCKNIFPLIKEEKMFTGYNFNKTMLFRISDEYEKYDTIENGVKYGKVCNCAWYTNVHIKKDKPLVLTKSYYENPELYHKYDNYDAINVDKIKDIPYDYEGVMGVPITFLDKYNPTQFEIVGLSQGDIFIECGGKGVSKKFVDDYYKGGGKGQISEGKKIIVLYDNNGKAVVPYKRILIKHK